MRVGWCARGLRDRAPHRAGADRTGGSVVRAPRASGTAPIARIHAPLALVTKRIAATSEAGTVFPGKVRDPGARVLAAGYDSAKLGRKVVKKAWRGMPIYYLTLEERATCPKSCAHWTNCYGNSMHMAVRFRHGPALEAAVGRDLDALAMAHPQGFVVRLMLGDFYSVAYVRLWREWLARCNGFGYTAWPRESEIDYAVYATTVAFRDRFAVRRSGASAARLAARTIGYLPERARQADGIVCPHQLGLTANCGTCGLCWSARTWRRSSSSTTPFSKTASAKTPARRRHESVERRSRRAVQPQACGISADWYNSATGRHYCRNCARLINRLNRGEPDAPFCRRVASRGGRVSVALSPSPAEIRWAAYAKAGGAFVRGYRAGDVEIRVFEMTDPKLELKFVAVPASGDTCPFFTLDALLDYAPDGLDKQGADEMNRTPMANVRARHIGVPAELPAAANASSADLRRGVLFDMSPVFGAMPVAMGALGAIEAKHRQIVASGEGWAACTQMPAAVRPAPVGGKSMRVVEIGIPPGRSPALEDVLDDLFDRSGLTPAAARARLARLEKCLAGLGQVPAQARNSRHEEARRHPSPARRPADRPGDRGRGCREDAGAGRHGREPDDDAQRARRPHARDRGFCRAPRGRAPDIRGAAGRRCGACHARRSAPARLSSCACRTSRISSRRWGRPTCAR